MITTSQNLQGLAAGLSQYELVDLLAELAAAPDLATAHVRLKKIADTVGTTHLAFAPNVSHPTFDRHMDAFLRQEGWPEEIISSWWDRNIMLKSPIYIRCRVGSEPFITNPSKNLPARNAELKKISVAMAAMGHRSLITTPIHLPRARVAKISWASPIPVSEARAVLAKAGPIMSAAGHLFMRAYIAEAVPVSSNIEELASLTLREWECLRLTAQGYREAQVGELLSLSATTVRYHLDNVARKLGAVNRVHAVALAAQLGLLGPIG